MPLDHLDTHFDPIIPAFTIGCTELGIAPQTLRRAWARGEIELIRVSKRRVGMRRSEIRRYLSERVMRHDKD
jgi:hypothetical protein